MENDLLSIGIWQLQRRADEGDLAAAAVLDELHRLRRGFNDPEHAHGLDTDAAFTDVTQYTQTTTYEVLR